MLTVILASLFLALSLLHLYWLAGGRWGIAAAVPEVNGRRAFSPSRLATGFVAAALLASAGVVLALGGRLSLPIPGGIITGLGHALAAVFLLRAIRDFKLVGFFKRVRGTAFARMDTMLFSPLCLALALGVFLLAFKRLG